MITLRHLARVYPLKSGPYFALLDTGGEVTVLKIALVR